MSDDINALAEEYYDFRHRVSPTAAHLDGDYRFAGLFEDPSRVAEDGQISEDHRFAERARAIDQAGLSAQDRISREMIDWDATTRADLLSTRMIEYTVNPISGLQAMLPVYIPKLSFPTVEVAEELEPKFRAIGFAFRAMADRLRAGTTAGKSPAAFAVRETISQLDGWLALRIEADPLLKVSLPAALPDHSAWRSKLEVIIESEVRPALQVYRDVLHDEILPNARPDEHVGLTWLADGDATYRAAIRLFTTVDKSAAEIHEIGLRQVESLAEEYRQLGPEVTGSNDLETIFDALRSDPALHHETSEAVVADAKAALAKAKGAMGGWFGILPQADCDVGVDDERRRRLLLLAGARRQPGRDVLHEHERTDRLGPLPGRVDRLPRGDPGPPPPARDRQRADRHPRVPKARVHRCVRGGLGPVCRAAVGRDGPVYDARSTGWACSRPIRCAPAGWSSTPACTRSAGAGGRRSTTCWPTRRCVRTTSRPRSIATP